MTTAVDDIDRVEAGLGAVSRLPHRAAIGVVVVASVVVVVAFLLALGAAQPAEAVHIVVVADLHAKPRASTPVRVLGLHRQGLVPLDVVVNGAVVDDDGFGTAVVDVGRRLHVTGTARLVNGEARNVDLELTLPPATAPTLSTTPSSTVDRNPVTWRFDAHDVDVIVVILHARAATSAVVTVFVGDRVSSMQRLGLGVGDTRWTVPLPATAQRGDLVVIGLATSLLPSVPVRQLVTRVGALSDDDVSGRRVVVAGAVPAIVSPTFAEQAATAKQRDDDDAHDLRAIFRGAAIVQLLCLLLMAVAARPRFVTAALALLVVVSFDLGLDAVLGVTGSVVISGSP